VCRCQHAWFSQVQAMQYLHRVPIGYVPQFLACQLYDGWITEIVPNGDWCDCSSRPNVKSPSFVLCLHFRHFFPFHSTSPLLYKALYKSRERRPTNAQGCCKHFLLFSINYPDMFRLTNAIFRGLHYPFISYSSFLVGVSGGCGLLFTRHGH
jgi:hypothetical protein